MYQYSHLIFANHEVAVHPGVVLLKDFRAVFALAEENLFTSRMHFGVLGYVVDTPFVHCPTIVFRRVFCHLLCSVSNRIWIFYERLFVISFSQEGLKRFNSSHYLLLVISHL